MVEAVCDPDGHHDYMRAPWRVGPWRCATDGTRLLGHLDELVAPEAGEPTRGLVTRWLGPDAEFVREEPLLALRARMGRPLLPVACPNCRGEGAFGNGGWEGSADDAEPRDVCWLCDDAGCLITSQIARAVRVGPRLYDCARIAWLLAHAEGDTVSIRQSGEVLVLRWLDGAGALMCCTSSDAIVETWGAT